MKKLQRFAFAATLAFFIAFVPTAIVMALFNWTGMSALMYGLDFPVMKLSLISGGITALISGYVAISK